MGVDRTLHYHAVIQAGAVLEQIQTLRETFPISLIVMGDQTSSKDWKSRLSDLDKAPSVILVDERYSSLEARDRYWAMYPPKGLGRWLPQGIRSIPRPIDDIVAILLIERYLTRLTRRNS
ncbi:MAG: resolvase [Cyanobacteria bacterium P01_G01_bin.38]